MIGMTGRLRGSEFAVAPLIHGLSREAVLVGSGLVILFDRRAVVFVATPAAHDERSARGSWMRDFRAYKKECCPIRKSYLCGFLRRPAFLPTTIGDM